MNKLAGILMLSMGLSASPAILAGGPADKATGSVELGEASPGVYFVFNAHEEKNGRPAKGQIYMLTPEGYYSQWHVGCVLVESPMAWFVGELTLTTDPDLQVGSALWVNVTDNGTPGTNGDTVALAVSAPGTAESLCEDLTTPPAEAVALPVLSGNLVVHAK